MLREQLPKIITTEIPGPNVKALRERRTKAIPIGMGQGYPIAIKRGEGAMYEDLDGNLFLDWIGGVGVLNVGYSHPEVIEAVKAQSEKYFHSMMAVSTHERYIELCEALNEIAPVKGKKSKSMLVNCGAEAIENAVKIAKGATKRHNVIVFTGAFHGRTSLTMSMTAKKKYAVGMGPFPEGIFRAPYPYVYRAPGNLEGQKAINYFVDNLKKVFDECAPANEIAAIVLEPIQGEGGFVAAPIEWVKAVRKICDEEGIMLVADEVQCGFARSGKFFASQYWKEAGCAPDIIACAKSIAAGLPLGACIASAEVMDDVPPATIGGTFCGNAVACAAALKVIEIIKRDKLDERAQEIGSVVMNRYNQWKEKYEIVGDVRGLGCMLGIEFVKDKTTKTPNPEAVKIIVDESLKRGLLIENAGTYGNVIRFLAPLVMTNEQTLAGLDIMEQAIEIASHS